MIFNNSNFKARSAQIVGGLLLFSAFNSVGCKNSTPVNPVHVTNVSVNTSVTTNQDEWLNFSITLSTQNFTVAALTLPILDPKDTTRQFGSFSLQPVLCSNPSTCPYGNGVQIGVNLDMTGILNTKGVAPVLPNGAALPIGGLQNSTVIALPIANTGAVIYFAVGKGVAMFGTAVPFAQMNGVGQTIPGANLFIPVTITTAKGPFTLLPGLFTGSAPNTTGVGFFADLSGLIPQSALLASLSQTPTHMTSSTSFEFGNRAKAEPVTVKS